MVEEEKKPILNDVKDRFLPLSESVVQCLEPEPKIYDFIIIKKLKEYNNSSSREVYLVKHKVTGVEYAIKVIEKRTKENINWISNFKKKVKILYKIYHPNIVKIYGHFEDNNYCYIIMEYISKGNLYNFYQLNKKPIPPQIASSLIKDIVSSVYFLHNMTPPIIHGEIKPENILIDQGSITKITILGRDDFNEYIDLRKAIRAYVDKNYFAPEILKKNQKGKGVDVWDIGVLLFELLTSHPPFNGEDNKTLTNNILNIRINWPHYINSDAKNLISKILKLEPKDRLKLEDIMKSPFITKYCPNASSYLIKPDLNIKYKCFVVNKDDPKK